MDNYKIDDLVKRGYLGCNEKCGKPKIYMVMMQQGDDMKEERFMCLTLERKNFAGITLAELVLEGVGNLGPH